jgi:polyhydroxyalkanoate synthesis regulator phasin
MQDAWRAYLELATGLTEASRKRARKVAKDLVGKGGATAAQLQSFAEDLVSTSRKNREGLVRLVRYEVDRALGALGLATADEVGELTNRVRELERQVRDGAERTPASRAAAGAATGAAGSAASAGTAKTTARKTTAKKTVAKKTAPTKATTPTKATAAKTTSARSTAAKKAAAPAKAAG